MNIAGEQNPLSWLLLNSIFLLGTFTFAVVLGVVSDDITQEVKRCAACTACTLSAANSGYSTQPACVCSIREGNYAVLTEGHILILNWNRQTGPLLRQLAVAQKQQFTNRPR